MRRPRWERPFSSDVKSEDSAAERKKYEAFWSRVVFGITRLKRSELQKDKNTPADLRATCKMKPILDLNQIRQLKYLASLARLPADQLENFSTRILVPRAHVRSG